MSIRAAQSISLTDGKIMTNSRSQRQKSRQKVAVLVLGMHRSGTSMLGGVLERLGCDGPKSRLPPNERNPKGYFESLEIMKLNDAILDALGSRWDDWQQLDNGWQDSPRFVAFRERMAMTVAAEYGDASLIYLKDPRICRLMPIWREVLVDAGYAPVCIHTYRNPMEVVQSLAARQEIAVEPEIGLLLWFRHVLDAEAASRGLPRVFTSYARLLSDWTEFSDRAEDAFGFSWPVARNVRQGRMRDMLDRGLRHHDASAKDPRQDRSVPELVKQCLEVMERWAGDGEDDMGRATLDRIATEFDASAALFAGSVVGLNGKFKIACANTKKLEILSQTFKEREMTIDAQNADLKTLADERDNLAALDADRMTEIEGLNAALETLRNENASLAARVAEQTAQIEARSAEHKKLREAHDRFVTRDAEQTAEIAGQIAELQSLREERDSLVARGDEQGAEIESLNAVLNKLKEERDNIGNERDTLTAEVAGFIEANISQGKTLARLNADLAAINAEKAALQAGLVALNAEKAAWIADAAALSVLAKDVVVTQGEATLPPVLPQQQSRSLWAKVIFRPSGKPKKAFRRVLFHQSGKPRGIFRKWVLLPDGHPRAAFHLWMCSPEYQALHGAVRVQVKLDT